ncbi:MAG: 3'-5' exonuclease [Moraxella sp.]|nr:3'-5' exonuclease [Moraxella sp.]
MFDKIRQLFSQDGKRNRQKHQLTRPEYAYLFDEPPADTWISLDLEMTGVNPKSDHILSVGAVKITRTDGVLSIDTAHALSIVCRPPVMPSKDSIVIHGLRPIDVENGVDYERMLATLLPFIGSCPIVGFCTDMDMAFINAIAKPYLGTTLANECLDVSLIDQTIRKRTNKNPDITIDRQHLSELLERYNIPYLPAHDASNDALMSAMLFCHLWDRR